jgi:hypothetical protein
MAQRAAWLSPCAAGESHPQGDDMARPSGHHDPGRDGASMAMALLATARLLCYGVSLYLLLHAGARLPPAPVAGPAPL